MSLVKPFGFKKFSCIAPKWWNQWEGQIKGWSEWEREKAAVAVSKVWRPMSEVFCEYIRFSFYEEQDIYTD